MFRSRVLARLLHPCERDIQAPAVSVQVFRSFTAKNGIKKFELETPELVTHLQNKTEDDIEKMTGTRLEVKRTEEQALKDTTKSSESGGPKGPEPTRYTDWEVNGRCSDF